MPQDRQREKRFRFSISTLLLCVAVFAVGLGAFLGFERLRAHTHRLAQIASQKRELQEVGATFAEANNRLHSVVAIDLTSTNVDGAWLQERIGYWEYGSVFEITVKAGQVSEECIAEIRGRRPQCKIVSVDIADPG